MMGQMAQRTIEQRRAVLKKLATGFVPPAGFTLTEGTYEGNGGWAAVPALILDGDGITITVVAHEWSTRWSSGSGHVAFDTKNGRRTFDRLGVEDSFYFDAEDRLTDLVATQLKKVAASRERQERSVVVPGLPGSFTLTPERLVEAKRRLTGKPGTFELTPAGFGIGYRLSVRPMFRHSTRAPHALAEFFGVERLYYDTLDCD